MVSWVGIVTTTVAIWTMSAYEMTIFEDAMDTGTNSQLWTIYDSCGTAAIGTDSNSCPDGSSKCFHYQNNDCSGYAYIERTIATNGLYYSMSVKYDLKTQRFDSSDDDYLYVYYQCDSQSKQIAKTYRYTDGYSGTTFINESYTLSTVQCDYASQVWIQWYYEMSGSDTRYDEWWLQNVYLIGSYNHPTTDPTDAPTQVPTDAPTNVPTNAPNVAPSNQPTNQPSNAPTDAPIDDPSNAPTDVPTDEPTVAPSDAPTRAPVAFPTDAPTFSPTDAPTTGAPTNAPTNVPTNVPTAQPIQYPTLIPTVVPTDVPTDNPTTIQPTPAPTDAPTDDPTSQPTAEPTIAPTLPPIEPYFDTTQLSNPIQIDGNTRILGIFPLWQFVLILILCFMAPLIVGGLICLVLGRDSMPFLSDNDDDQLPTHMAEMQKIGSMSTIASAPIGSAFGASEESEEQSAPPKRAPLLGTADAQKMGESDPELFRFLERNELQQLFPVLHEDLRFTLPVLLLQSKDELTALCKHFQFDFVEKTAFINAIQKEKLREDAIQIMAITEEDSVVHYSPKQVSIGGDILAGNPDIFFPNDEIDPNDINGEGMGGGEEERTDDESSIEEMFSDAPVKPPPSPGANANQDKDTTTGRGSVIIGGPTPAAEAGAVPAPPPRDQQALSPPFASPAGGPVQQAHEAPREPLDLFGQAVEPAAAPVAFGSFGPAAVGGDHDRDHATSGPPPPRRAVRRGDVDVVVSGGDDDEQVEVDYLNDDAPDLPPEEVYVGSDEPLVEMDTPQE